MTTKTERVSEEEIADWAIRHGINLNTSDLRAAFEDAATFWMTAEPTHGGTCRRCGGTGMEP